jgi:hypothetical protein
MMWFVTKIAAQNNGQPGSDPKRAMGVALFSFRLFIKFWIRPCPALGGGGLEPPHLIHELVSYPSGPPLLKPIAPPVYPSCLQATAASELPKESSQTVPQRLLVKISRRPAAWPVVSPVWDTSLIRLSVSRKASQR